MYFSMCSCVATDMSRDQHQTAPSQDPQLRIVSSYPLNAIHNDRVSHQAPLFHAATPFATQAEQTRSATTATTQRACAHAWCGRIAPAPASVRRPCACARAHSIVTQARHDCGWGGAGGAKRDTLMMALTRASLAGFPKDRPVAFSLLNAL